jgi:hypothetical protein
MLVVSDYKYLKNFYQKSFKKTFEKKLHKKTKIHSRDVKNLLDLKKNGYCILKNVFSKKLINDLNFKFQAQIKNLDNISIPRDLRKRKKNIESIYSSKIDKDIFISGEKKFRNFTDSIKLKDPLINLPELIDCSLNKRIISMCSNYFDCIPYLTFLKCVKTYKNKIKEHDTQHFHIDENSVKLLKVFIYLNDVNSKQDGPFYYVQKSFKNINKKWGQNARWNESYLKKIYGKKNFIPILAKRGDVIIANTVAFHRGIKPMKKDRNIAILNYGMHIDFTFNNKFDITSTILKKQYKNQTKANQSILSLLNKA